LEVDGQRVSPIPDTLPEWHFKGPPRPKLAKVDFSAQAQIPKEKVRVLFYISDEKPIEMGKFQAAETSQGEMQVDHFVLVQGASLRPGLSYIVTSPSLYIWSPQQKVWGQQWQINGVVRVLSLVNPEQNIFRAQVVEAYSRTGQQAILVEGQIRDAQIKNAFVSDQKYGIFGVGQIMAQVIGGAGGSPRSMFSRGEILYLDAGRSQGIGEGQSLQIFRNENSRSARLRGTIAQNARQIGIVTVVHVSDRFSTAVVVDSTEEICVGDQTWPILKP
jgi:hypothetical protein